MKIKQLKSPSESFDLRFAAGKAFDVVGFGTNSVDHLCILPEYPQLDSKMEILQYEMLPGGQVATALAFLSRMGLTTKYVGKVGGDDPGRFFMRSFESESVDTSSVIVEQNTGNQVAVILIDKTSGERTVLSRRGSGLDFRDSELLREDICAGRILHLDGYDAVGSLKAAAWCREEGIPVSIDLDKVVPNCRALMDKIDFLIVSANFAVELTGVADPVEAFRGLRNYHDGFHAVTLGANGAIARVGEKCITFPGLVLPARDTTGAGDIFHAGFIYGLIQNWSLNKTMSFANAAAGLSCGYLGARTGIRPFSEILPIADDLLRQYENGIPDS